MSPKKKAKNTAYWLTRAALQGLEPPHWEKARLTLHFYFAHNRRRDKDNLIAWCKAYLDGVAAAGIVCDDSAFQAPEVITEIDPTNERLKIIVEPIE